MATLPFHLADGRTYASSEFFHLVMSSRRHSNTSISKDRFSITLPPTFIQVTGKNQE